MREVEGLNFKQFMVNYAINEYCTGGAFAFNDII
jgi:hypothetical protein